MSETPSDSAAAGAGPMAPKPATYFAGESHDGSDSLVEYTREEQRKTVRKLDWMILPMMVVSCLRACEARTG